jgi:biotin carboxyl carrier protein
MKRLSLVSGDKEFPLEVAEDSGKIRVSIAGEPIGGVTVGNRSEGGLSLLINDRSYEAQVMIEDRQVTVALDGERFVFEVDDGMLAEKRSRRGGGGGLAEVKAPMPGKVVKLLVSSGDSVEAGQGILLFEAMKMQNEIKSPLAGEVVEMNVKEGQAVESRERLFAVKGNSSK